jgi:hypothetical protein
MESGLERQKRREKQYHKMPILPYKYHPSPVLAPLPLAYTKVPWTSALTEGN